MRLERKTKNRLLAALSSADFAELSDDLHPVTLPKKEVVYEARPPGNCSAPGSSDTAAARSRSSIAPGSKRPPVSATAWTGSGLSGCSNRNYLVRIVTTPGTGQTSPRGLAYCATLIYGSAYERIEQF
jgi:hypothetical protein